MYVVTGATGNTGHIVAKQLLANGQKVRAVSRTADRLQFIVAEGAEPFVADLNDKQALSKAFAGARAVYSTGRPSAKPDLAYKQLPDERVRTGMVHSDISVNMATLFLEMAAALNSGYRRPLEPRSARNTTPTSFAVFVAEEFVPAYQGNARAA